MTTPHGSVKALSRRCTKAVGARKFRIVVPVVNIEIKPKYSSSLKQRQRLNSIAILTRARTLFKNEVTKCTSVHP